MAVYRFPVLTDAERYVSGERPRNLPPSVRVMHAGECVCDAELMSDAYVCDLPDEFAGKLDAGKLDEVYVSDPPLLGQDADEEVERELVPILLVGASRRHVN